jgi:hypothetical protein
MGKGGWLRGLTILTGTAALLAAVATADAQPIVPTPDPGRDCQTVRTCNFTRGGEVRGCLSSYTCRTCKMVRSRCNLAGRRYCERVVCSWGG